MATALYTGVVGFVGADLKEAIVNQKLRSSSFPDGYKLLHTTIPFIGVLAGGTIYFNYSAQAGDGEAWIEPGTP